MPQKCHCFSLFWWAYLFFVMHKWNDYLVNAHQLLEAFSLKHVPLAHMKKQIIKTPSPQAQNLCFEVLIIGQLKVKEVKNVLPFLKFMKRPQTKFHDDTKSEYEIARSKILKVYHYVEVCLYCRTLFPVAQFFLITNIS